MDGSEHSSDERRRPTWRGGPTPAGFGWAVAIAACWACGGEGDRDVSASDPPSARSTSDGPSEAGACEATVSSSPPPDSPHVLPCSQVEYPTNPPSGGPHYPSWPAFQEYDFEVPEGFVVHALEHGAVAFWYDCPAGCEAELGRMRAFIDGLPDDPLCREFAAPRRVVLTPSSRLPTRWAASAWGWTLTADCFDEDIFGGFYAEHYGQGPESLCDPGVVGSTECRDP